MITFNKVYIWLSKINHLSLRSLSTLIILKNTKNILIIYMRNSDFQEKQFHISDPIESYFECISACDMRDGKYISMCGDI